MPAELQDDVVLLRAWLPDDAHWYVAWTQDPDAQRFTTDPPTLTTEDVEAAIVALADQPARAAYLVADRATGRPVGNVALDLTGDVGDISYAVAAEARGRGIATHALRLVAATAFQRLELSELRLWTHADNTASRLVAERAGFHRDTSGDRLRAVKGETWPTVAYLRRR